MNPLSPPQSGESSVVRFAPAVAVPGNAGSMLGDAELCRLEQALLDAILDVQPNGTNALDRLLDDMDDADGANDDTATATHRGIGHSRRQQVEQFLLAAVLDTTPERGRTLDQLMGEVPDPGIFAAYA